MTPEDMLTMATIGIGAALVLLGVRPWLIGVLAGVGLAAYGDLRPWMAVFAIGWLCYELSTKG